MVLPLKNGGIETISVSAKTSNITMNRWRTFHILYCCPVSHCLCSAPPPPHTSWCIFRWKFSEWSKLPHADMLFCFCLLKIVATLHGGRLLRSSAALQLPSLCINQVKGQKCNLSTSVFRQTWHSVLLTSCLSSVFIFFLKTQTPSSLHIYLCTPSLCLCLSGGNGCFLKIALFLTFHFPKLRQVETGVKGGNLLGQHIGRSVNSLVSLAPWNRRIRVFFSPPSNQPETGLLLQCISLSTHQNVCTGISHASLGIKQEQAFNTEALQTYLSEEKYPDISIIL